MKPLEYLEAIIGTRPIAWARAGTDPNGRRFTPKRYQAWKDRAVPQLQASAKLRRFPGEVAVAIDVFPDRTEVRISAIEPEDRRRQTLRGDVDNYAKAVLDALQDAGTLTDDHQVADLRVRFRPERPSK